MRGPLSAALCVAALGLGAHAAVVNKNPDPATYAERLRFGEDISLTATGATTATSILTAVTPVYGHPLCDYSAAINYSGKRYLLTIDTGSSNNAVASTTCTTCGPGSSFTVSQTNLKPYTAYYGTAAFSTSWTGALVSGQASVAGLGSLTQMPFSSDVSAILSQNNFFRQSCFGYTNGILGLAYAGVSQFGSVSFVDTLTTNNVPNGFALQLCNPTYPLSPQQQTGNWWIGGYSTKYMTSAMQFTPITEELWYGVNLLGISVAGKSVETEDLSKPRAIIDSGTNVLLFSDENYEEVVEALIAAKAVSFASSISSSLQSAFWKGSQLSLPANSFALNPKATINLKLAGMANGTSVNLPISPTEYVTAYGPDARGFMNISLAIAASGGGGQLATIIGLPAHINKMIFYDRGNKRIGFASSACNMTGPFGGLKPALATDLNVLAPLPIPKDLTPMSGDSPRSPTSAIGTQMSSSAEVLRCTRIAAVTALVGSLLLAHRI